jgi:ABC-type transport system involved in multi-copper enzyme maturation permease subunit
MKPTIRYVFVTALRDRLFISLLGLMLLTFAGAAYLGSAAIAEKQAMTAVYVGGAARVILVFGLIIFTAFHIERLYETREIEALLSRAISRESFIFSYWLGMVGLVVVAMLPVAAVVAYFSLTLEGAVYWLAGVLLEGFIVVAFAMFAALTLERAIPTVFAAA